MLKTDYQLNYILNYLSFKDVPMIKFEVGITQTTFLVHLELLCSASPYFKAALTKGFLEAYKKSMKIPEDDPDQFEFLVQWLYTKKLNLPDPDINEARDERYLQLCDLYILADKYRILGMKNHIIDYLFMMLPKKPARRSGVVKPIPKAPRMMVIVHVYKNTMNACTLRRLLVAWYVSTIDFWGSYHENMTHEILCTLPEFSADLVIAMTNNIPFPMEKDPMKGDSSAFHDKDPEEKGITSNPPNDKKRKHDSIVSFTFSKS